jgi:hypothetical protein
MTEPSGDFPEHITNLATSVAIGIVVAVLYLWVGRHSPSWLVVWSQRFLLAAIGALVVCAAAEAVILSLIVRRNRKNEDDRRRKEHEAARANRRERREATREFALFLEDQYSWVLEMDKLERQRRALLWYDEITSRWVEENRRFHKLRADDERAVIDQEIGLSMIRRMLSIWQRRTQLYQYAVAWSDPAQRAKEVLRIGRLIRQAQVEEAQERRRFAEVIDTRVLDDTRKDDDTVWGPRPLEEDGLASRVLRDMTPRGRAREAK